MAVRTGIGEAAGEGILGEGGIAPPVLLPFPSAPSSRRTLRLTAATSWLLLACTVIVVTGFLRSVSLPSLGFCGIHSLHILLERVHGGVGGTEAGFEVQIAREEIWGSGQGQKEGVQDRLRGTSLLMSAS